MVHCERSDALSCAHGEQRKKKSICLLDSLGKHGIVLNTLAYAAARRTANHEAFPSSVGGLEMVWCAVSARRAEAQSSLVVLKAITVLPPCSSMCRVNFWRSLARSDTCVFTEERLTDKVITNMRAEAKAAMKGMFNDSSHVSLMGVVNTCSSSMKQYDDTP